MTNFVISHLTKTVITPKTAKIITLQYPRTPKNTQKITEIPKNYPFAVALE
jgi:hypothetical protein